MDSPALVVQQDALLPAQVHAQVQLIQQIMRDVMKEGEHFGTIPGCGDKSVLMKSGAEKLCFTFQLVPTFDVVLREYERGHREYEVRTKLHTRAGVLIGEGVGTCSTLESKYRYRNAARKCPVCGKEAIIKGKEEYGGGWVCFKKKDGCGAKWEDGAAEIEKQEAGKVENPDPADTYNTVLKIAKKRSLVDGTITACAASDLFTQDLEENASFTKEEGEVSPRADRAHGSKPSSQEIPQGKGQARQSAAASTEKTSISAATAAPAAKSPTVPTTTGSATTAPTATKPNPTDAELRASKARADEASEFLRQGTAEKNKAASAVDVERIRLSFSRAAGATSRDQALEVIAVIAGDGITKPSDVPSHKVEPLLVALDQLAGIETEA